MHTCWVAVELKVHTIDISNEKKIRMKTVDNLPKINSF